MYWKVSALVTEAGVKTRAKNFAESTQSGVAKTPLKCGRNMLVKDDRSVSFGYVIYSDAPYRILGSTWRGRNLSTDKLRSLELHRSDGSEDGAERTLAETVKNNVLRGKKGSRSQVPLRGGFAV